MADIRIRLATDQDLPQARAAFIEWGYRGGAKSGERIFMAEHGSQLVGLVRLVEEEGVGVLRGLRIAPRFQQKGVGTALVRRLIQSLGSMDCYCLPLATYDEFFAKSGFRKCPRESAPRFLADRLVQYQHGGGNFMIMYRPGKAPSNDTPGTVE